MERITIYHNSDGSRDFHFLLNQIATHMEKNMGATWLRTYDTDIEWLSHNAGDRMAFLRVLDCEILIHYHDRDSYVGMTFGDYHTEMTSFFIMRNSSKDLLLCSQYSNTALAQEDVKNYVKFRWFPSLYVKSNYKVPKGSELVDHDEYYKKRQSTQEYIDKFIFRGNVHSMGRGSAIALEGNRWFEGPHSMGAYHFEELTKYKVGLCIPGMGELCYRDIEYMAIGIPMMKFEYVTQLNPPLVPNHHYISIDRIDTEQDWQVSGGIIAAERNGGERQVSAYLKRFLEVKDDKEFLDKISNNAREYYETYLHPDTRLQHALRLMEII